MGGPHEAIGAGVWPGSSGSHDSDLLRVAGLDGVKREMNQVILKAPITLKSARAISPRRDF